MGSQVWVRVPALFVLLSWAVPAVTMAQDAEPVDPDEAGTSAEQTADDPVARARQEFAAGIACVEEHETRCAIEHFRTALTLHDAPAIRYNLASALFELGHYPEVARLIASVLADEGASEEIRGHSEALREQIAADGGTLTVTIAGSTDGVEIEVDGEAVPSEERVALPLRAGDHQVRAVRDGRPVAEESVSVEAQAEASVELVVAPSAEELAAQAPPEPEPAADPEFYEDWPFWAAVGGGVALIVLIAVVAVVAAENATLQEPISGDYNPGVLRW